MMTREKWCEERKFGTIIHEKIEKRGVHFVELKGWRSGGGLVLVAYACSLRGVG